MGVYKYEIRDPETIEKGVEKVILESLHYYRNEYTPNVLLKLAKRKGILGSMVEQGEAYAYLDHYDALYRQAQMLLKTDNHHRFAILINTYRDLIEKFPPLGLFEDICRHCAVACATTFLQSGFSLDLNNKFENSDYRPLDYGALHSSPALTQLLLQYGANPDYESYHGFSLDIALNHLCHHEFVIQWTPDKSIYKLLYILCLPELKEHLDTIKLLASHMKHVDKVYADLIKWGHVHKLAALLLAAKDQLLVPSAQGGGPETTPIGEYISKKLATELEQVNWVMTDSESTSIDQSKPNVELLNYAYNVVKIMWKAADILDRYHNSEWTKNVLNFEVPFDIAHDLVKDAELVMNPEDVYCNDIKCNSVHLIVYDFDKSLTLSVNMMPKYDCPSLRPSVTSPSVISLAEVLSKRICFEKHLRPLHSPHPLVGVQNPALGIQSLFSSFCMTSSPHHSYHTWQAVNIKPATSTGTGQLGSSSMSIKPPRSCHTWQAVDYFNINKHVETQTTHIKPLLCNVIASARVCAPLMWMAKRSIKYCAL